MNRQPEPACDKDAKKAEPAFGQSTGSVELTQDEVARLVAQQTESWRRIGAMPNTEARRVKHEAFTRDAVRAWAEYQQTGLHVTGEEMDRRMTSCGTDHELPPPEYHT